MSLSSTVTHSFDNINMIVTICMFLFVCVVSCLLWLSLYQLYLALFSFVCTIYVL